MVKLNLRPERLQLEWISAAEGMKFADIMHKVETLRQTVRKEEIDKTIEVLKNQKK